MLFLDLSIFLLFYSSIVYHIAEMMKIKGMEAPRNILFSGTGSKTLNEKLIYYFDSAWAPPVSLLENISVKYPHLKFSISYNIFEEMGDESKVVSVENGKLQ